MEYTIIFQVCKFQEFTMEMQAVVYDNIIRCGLVWKAHCFFQHDTMYLDSRKAFWEH